MASSLPAVAGLFAIAIGCYVNALGGPLLFDDVHAIVDNPAVHALDLRTIFLTPSWWGSYNPVYRPVTTLTFALDWAAHGAAPFGYHLVNVFLHGGVTVLVARVLHRVTGERVVAFLAALLFATHPVHTEAVAGVVGRAELLAVLFGLAAWLVLTGRDATRFGLRPVLAAMLLSCAVLSKESAVGLVGAVIAADVVYSGPRGLRRVWPGWVVLGTAALAALALRTAVLGRVVPTADRLDNVLAAAPMGPRLMTAVAVMAKYAGTLVWPFRLSADYSYAQVRLVESSAQPLFLAGVGVLVASAALAAWGWRRNAHVCFAVAFTAATFAVVSNLVVPIGTIMAERLLYLPSIGFCLLVAIGIERVVGRRPLALLLTVVLAGAYGAGTVWRNRVWTDRLLFFETMVRDAPESARSHRELAVVYSELGQHDRAREEIRLALRQDPGNSVTLYNLGNAELRAKRFDEAIAAYQAALEQDPEQVDSMTNLGNTYSARGDERSAELWFRRGLERRPDSAALRVNLANALLRQGRASEAEEQYRAALERAPADALTRFNYGVCLESLGRFSDAADQYRQARQLLTQAERAAGE